MQKAYFLMLMQCHVLEADRFTTLLPGQIQMNLCMFLQFHVFRIFLSLYSSVALTSECNFILTYFSKHIYLILFKAFLAFPGWVLHEAQEFFLSDMQESLLTVNHPINTIGYMLNFCLDIFFSFWSIVIIIYFGLFFYVHFRLFLSNILWVWLMYRCSLEFLYMYKSLCQFSQRILYMSTISIGDIWGTFQLILDKLKHMHLMHVMWCVYSQIQLVKQLPPYPPPHLGTTFVRSENISIYSLSK